MSYIGNSPQSETVLRLEARKSFALGLELRDRSARPLDVSTATFSIVAKRDPENNTEPNLFANYTATPIDAGAGLVRFQLQGTDLDHPAGEYAYSIVMLSEGYSSVIVKGVIDLLPNTEYASVGSVYTGTNPPASLIAELQGQRTISVYTGVTLAPGTTSFTDGDKAKLDGIEFSAQKNVSADWAAGLDAPNRILNKPVFGSAAFVNAETIGVPLDGTPGEVLTKRSAAPGDYGWAQPTGGGGGGSGLDATGVPVGQIPTANGADGWSWDPAQHLVQSVNGQAGAITLDQDNISDTPTRVAMTVEERSKLAELNSPPAWTDLAGRPTLGSAAAMDTNAFLAPGAVTAGDITSGVLDPLRLPKVSSLRGYSSGTSVPSGGADGDIYFQYTV